MSERDVTLRSIRIGFLIALVLLMAQFLLGMGVNLFVNVPTDHPGSNPPEYFGGVAQSVTWAILHGPVLLVLHSTFGLVLVLAAIGLFVRSVRSREKSVILTSGIGALSVVAAGFNGGSYLNYHEDFSSMIMASAFAVAVVAYAIGMHVAARPAATS